MEDNKIVADRLPHDECGAEKARVLYADGHWYCFKCETYGREKGDYPMSQPSTSPIKGVINNVLSKGESMELKSRNISLDTVKKYGVTAKVNKHIYPYFDKDSCHVANKVRQTDPKNFFTEGDLSSRSVGQKRLEYYMLTVIGIVSSVRHMAERKGIIL